MLRNGHKQFQPRWIARYITFYIRSGSTPSVHTLELTQHIPAYIPALFLPHTTRHEVLFSSSTLARTRCFSVALNFSFSFSLAFCLKPGSRGYHEFYDPLRRRKLEISHVKVDTTERARDGEHGKPSRDAGGCDRGKVKKIRAKATAERLLHPPLSSLPSCRLSRDSAGLIRSRGRDEAENGDVVFVGGEGRQRRDLHLGFQQQERRRGEWDETRAEERGTRLAPRG